MATPVKDKRKFEAELSRLTDEINAKKSKMVPSSAGADAGREASEELQEVIALIEKLEGERKQVMAEIKRIDEEIRTLGACFSKERDKANKLIPSLKYKSEELYKEQIKKLELQLQKNFAQLSTNDRRKLQQTIETLKEAKDKLKDYLEIRETMDKCRAKQDELRKRKDSLHQKNKTCRERVNSCHDDAERLRKEMHERKGQQKTKKAEQEALSKEINELYQERKRLHEEFRLKQNEYIAHMRSITGGERGMGGERGGAGGKSSGSGTGGNDKLTVERDQRPMKQSTRVEVTGHDEERTICLTLINYLSRLSSVANRSISPSLLRTYQTQPPSASPDGSTTPNEVRKVFSPPLPATETDDMVVYQRKKLEEEDEWIPASHRDRNSRRKTRRRKSFSGSKTLSKSLQHNATIFGQFSRLGLQPPITSADISKVSDQLRGLLIKYESNKAESEAGDSGIMSSTGISEISDTGHMTDINLTSGEVTPNKLHPHDHSPSPPPLAQNDLDRSSDTIVNS